VTFRKALEKSVLRWEVVRGYGHYGACRSKNGTIRRGPILVSLPVVEETCLVDMPIDPVAIFEIVGYQTIDNIHRRE
jgi:hypothetical protein